MATSNAAPSGLSHEHSLARLKLERRWAEEAASGALSGEDYQWWALMQSAHRIMLQMGKRVLVWKLFMGKPAMVDAWAVVNMRLQAHTGMAVLLERESDGEQVWVSHTPTLLAPGVFIWLPAYIDYQYVPKASDDDPERVVRLSAIVRMQRNPATKEEQINYIGDRRSFDEAVAHLGGGS